MDISAIFESQGKFFQSGATRSYRERMSRLKRLETAIREFEPQLLEALRADLGRSSFEGFLGELYLLYDEIKYARRHLRRLMRPQVVTSSLMTFYARSRVMSEPVGRTLILGPWNYPAQLVLAPLIGSLAAGNVAMLKPSELAPETARVLSLMLSKHFSSDEVSCVTGDAAIAQELLALPFDHIFFTGGGGIGRKVMEAAARNLCPVTLELGGKSPCLLAEPLDLKMAIPRIVWGKFFNAGQTCVAPDYLLVPEGRREAVIAQISQTLAQFFGADPKDSPDFGRVISARHFDRLLGLMAGGKVALGGKSDAATRYLSPTVLIEPDPSSPLMREEIFGPLLPIVTYRSLDEALAFIKAKEKPLALYVFTSAKNVQDRVLNEVSFGGGCVNDTLVHLSNPRLPFGGVGASGMGRYHGKYSFETFSHAKAVVRRGRWFDWKLRFPPYKKRFEKLRPYL